MPCAAHLFGDPCHFEEGRHSLLNIIKPSLMKWLGYFNLAVRHMPIKEKEEGSVDTTTRREVGVKISSICLNS